VHRQRSTEPVHEAVDPASRDRGGPRGSTHRVCLLVERLVLDLARATASTDAVVRLRYGLPLADRSPGCPCYVAGRLPSDGCSSVQIRHGEP
jgi:hypothetical protein